MIWRAAALAACALAGCAEAEDPACVDNVVAWENFGDGFFITYCQGCHASTTLDRLGAPEEVRFDDEAQAIRWADDALRRVEADTMPPGGGVLADDLAHLQAWVRCVASEG